MAEVLDRRSEQPSPYVVSDEGVVGGSPRISGTRVRVLDVFIMYRAGKSALEISESFDLSLEQVHASLSYYFANEDEIKQELDERDEIIDESRGKHDSKL